MRYNSHTIQDAHVNVCTFNSFFSIFRIVQPSHNFILSYFIFLWLHLRPMEVLGLGVRSELQLPAYASATAAPDLSCICDLCCSLWQHWILNSLGKTREQTCILMDTTQVLNPLSHSRNSLKHVL